ncbi:MAG: hypothetical protein WB777_05290, partial [Mycobacterium sp.]
MVSDLQRTPERLREHSQPARRHRRRLLRHEVDASLPGVAKATLHRVGGMPAFLSERVYGRVFVSTYALQPGRPNSNDGLQQDLSSA